MKKPFFWEKAKKVLISKDKKLGKIISNYPRDFLFSKSEHIIMKNNLILELRKIFDFIKLSS